jgi:predicted RNA-binding protein YlxR (DUF448 family)
MKLTLKMCILCGKQRPEGEFYSLVVGEVEEGINLKMMACKGCHVVLHNVKRVFEEKRKEWFQKKIKQQEEVKDEITKH